MKKEYISPEVEIQKFTIFCDEILSQPYDPDTDPDEGGNEFDF